MRRVALPSSGLYPLAVLVPDDPGVRRHRRPARVRLRRGLRRRAGARQQRAAAPGRDPVVRRGGRLARPDRAVRDARAAASRRAGSAGRTWWSRSLAGLLLTFVARPLSVLACSVGDRLSLREQAFVSWAGLRGAVPIVLATIPLAEGVAGGERAVRHRLRDGGDLHPAHRADPAVGGRPARRDRSAASRATSRSRRRRWSGSPPTCCRSASPARSRMHGVEVGELRLPRRGVGLAGRPGRADAGAGAAHRAAPRRRPAGRDAAPAARGDRGRGCARCRGAAGWRTGWTTRTRRLSAAPVSGADRRWHARRRRPPGHDHPLALRQLAGSRRRPPRRRPGPRLVTLDEHLGLRAELAGHEPGGGVVRAGWSTPAPP